MVYVQEALLRGVNRSKTSTTTGEVNRWSPDMANSTNAYYGGLTPQSAAHMKFEWNFIYIHMIHCLQYWGGEPRPSPKTFQKQYCDANWGGLTPPCTDSRSSAFFPTRLNVPPVHGHPCFEDTLLMVTLAIVIKYWQNWSQINSYMLKNCNDLILSKEQHTTKKNTLRGSPQHRQGLVNFKDLKNIEIPWSF